MSAQKKQDSLGARTATSVLMSGLRMSQCNFSIFFSVVTFAVYNTIFTESGLFGRVPILQIFSMQVPILMLLGYAHA